MDVTKQFRSVKWVIWTGVTSVVALSILINASSMGGPGSSTKSYLEMNPKIFSGRPASIRRHRHLVVVLALFDEIIAGEPTELESQGHGALLTLKWVVTAHHVVQHSQAHEIYVFAGVNRRSNLDNASPNVQVQAVCMRVLHPSYQRMTHNGPNHDVNDIALLKLRGAFKQGLWVKALGYAAIPYYYHENVFGQFNSCKVAGFGMVDENVHVDELQEASLWLVPSYNCLQLGYLSPPTQVSLCATHQHSATYGGDSGTPLMCSGCFLGVLSGGAYNASTPKSQRISIYARVDFWKGWIIDTIESVDING